MKKAMISQPMNGKTDDEITSSRERAILKLNELGYEVVNTLFDDDWSNRDKMLERGVKHIPLAFLARSLEKMAECDAVYFCDDYENARGCRVEHEVARAYGVTCIYE